MRFSVGASVGPVRASQSLGVPRVGGSNRSVTELVSAMHVAGPLAVLYCVGGMLYTMTVLVVGEPLLMLLPWLFAALAGLAWIAFCGVRWTLTHSTRTHHRWASDEDARLAVEQNRQVARHDATLTRANAAYWAERMAEHRAFMDAP